MLIIIGECIKFFYINSDIKERLKLVWDWKEIILLVMNLLMNVFKSECFIDVLVIIFIGKYEYVILLNVIFNIGFMFIVVVGNILIIFSFMLVLFLCIILNYVLFGLVLIDFGVGFIVYLLYILVLYWVYKNVIFDCNIVIVYSVLMIFFVGVLLLYIIFIGLDWFLVIWLYLRYLLFVIEKWVSLV